ncbi:MAG: hypothetical protein QM233_05635 [Candidatus Cloacimonadota bacterium]|jgi:V/A-type H+-transporting ATPase subunit E|nr:hypothetical protein [Candidatus Cloacimonadota bacterium]
MSDQLQDLLKRVYEEGVSKAQSEADEIKQSAQAQASEIIQNAKDEAEKIIAEAQKNAAELGSNTESDLKMAAQHTISAVKQKLTDVFLSNAFDQPLKESLGEVKFVQQIIMEIVSTWKESGGKITISKSMEGKLDEFFLKSIKSDTAKGLSIDFSPQMKSGFSVSPADGSYKLSFTDEDFANLFKSYLRPRSNQLLFK